MKKKVWIWGIIIIIVVGFFGTVEIFHFTSEPEFCAICHPKREPGPNGEVYTWEHSIHAKAGITCLDCHAKPGVLYYFERKIIAVKDPITQLTHSQKELDEMMAHPSAEAAPEQSCLFCHTDDFNKKYRSTHFMSLPTKFLRFRNLDYVVNPQFREAHGLKDIMKADHVAGYYFSHSEHMENFDNLRCTTCHFNEFAHPDNRINYAYKMKMVCFKCHKEEGGPKDSNCVKCHVVQNEIRHAKIKGAEGDEDVMADLGCDDCHASFKKLPGKQTCIDCHDGDKKFGETLVQWKNKIKERLAKTGKLYEKARAKAEKDKSLQKKFFEGERLYKTVLNDKSFGVHNFEYVNTILDKADKIFSAMQ